MSGDKDNFTIEHIEVAPTKKKRNSELYFETALILVLGFLIGMVCKTEAVKRVTMGYEDYQVASVFQAYNFKSLEDDLMKKYEAQMEEANPSEDSEDAESDSQAEEVGAPSADEE